MAKFKRHFLKGVMNKDVDERLLKNGQVRNALNIDTVTSEGSDAGTIRNIAGNTEVADVGNIAGAAAVNARTIGAVTSDKDNIIYWFVTSDNYDGIYEYNETTGNSNRILQSSTGQLNFSADYVITGLNYVDGFLYWTDDLNEPRSINISTVRQWDIDDARIDEYIPVIVAPPLRAPSIEMLLEENQETNMEDKFLQFATRFKYSDDQYSALSPFSPTAFVPGDFIYNYATGYNSSMLGTKNKVRITFETGGRFVEEIHLFFRDSTSLNVKRIEKFNKEVLNLNNNTSHRFFFKNSKDYSVLSNSQVTRLYDNVPLKAKAQDVIGRRLAYGNYVQGFDIADCSGAGIKIDYDVDYVSEEVAVNTAIQTFRSDRDYEVGIVYADDYGRTTTVLTTPIVSSGGNNNNIYIPPTASDLGNSIVVKINSQAPCFATNYRLVLKESKRNYYNIFPILYYGEGTYRYFLINKSDLDKFSIGEYIIFKSNASGVTYTNEKYKILDIETKPAGYFSGTSPSGVYFKINDEDYVFGLDELTCYYSEGKGAAGTRWSINMGASGNTYYQLNTRKAIDAGTEFRMAETPIFYGNGLDGLSISASPVGGGYQYLFYRDMRVIIEIDSADTFRYRIHPSVGPYSQYNPGWISENLPIQTTPQSLPIITQTSAPSSPFNIIFSQDTGYTPGDTWVVNCRGIEYDLSNDYNTNPNEPMQNGWFSGVAISNLGNIPIKIGAIIRIGIGESGGGQSTAAGQQTFPPSGRTYENIEEWYYGEQIYLLIKNFNGNGDRIYFRRGAPYLVYPAPPVAGSGANAPVNSISQQGMGFEVRMMITGQSPTNTLQQSQKTIVARWELCQYDNPLIAETEPKSIDTEIFHELGRTMPIINNEHQVMWQYADFTNAGTVWGNNLWYGTLPIGKTNIGMLDPTAAPSATDIPHTYVAGDIIYLTPDSTIVGPQSSSVGYEVLYVPNPYNIIIDVPWPGAGGITGGGTCYFNESEGTVEQNQDGLMPAIIKINHPQSPNSYYNAYSFGNGLESNRIRDDFNATILEQSIRASIIIDGYGEERKESSICYSGVYRGDSSINRLNEFNLSATNYKNLDREFGSIQKLHARDTDLVVLQENKISNLLYEKNILTDASGGGQVSSINAVLGTQVPFIGEYGISNNPESFAEWGGKIFFTDERRGSVIKIENGQIEDIAKYWMKDHFRDLFSEAPKTQKLGVYDPYKQQYIIASNNEDSSACRLELSIDSESYPALSETGEYENNSRPDFFVISNTSWTAAIVYDDGSGWVSGFPAAGFGDESVYLAISNNNSAAVRVATITFTYCDASTVTFVITQSRGAGITIRPILSYNGKFKKF
jgi:hypothetical protein